jgi:hypothetical protein
MTQYSDSPSSEQQEFKVGTVQPSAGDTISRGRDAWARLREGQCWTDWIHVAAALATGRSVAMREAQTNTPHGARYRAAIGTWLRCWGFDGIDKTTRSRLLDCHDNLTEISAWRNALPSEKQRLWNHPRVVLTRWRKSLQAPTTKPRARKAPPGLAAAWAAEGPAGQRAQLDRVGTDQLCKILSPKMLAELRERMVKQDLRGGDSSSTLAVLLTQLVQTFLSANNDGTAISARNGILSKLRKHGRTYHDIGITILGGAQTQSKKRRAA